MSEKHETKHFVDANGVYIGGFGDGAAAPVGAIEVSRPPSAFHSWNGENWIPPAPNSEQVDAERDRRIRAGMIANVAPHGDIPVQGRPTDKDNLMGLATSAQLLIANGAGATITNFRDADNVIHDLTQPQVLDLWQQAAAYVSLCFQSAWALKDGSGGIPHDFTDDTYWP
ncbi:DUF4376 domain-containing protein [Roseovarius pacificus]|uniref:DUF4376 domain-containing protein n=1 Tax=Roseovarius pacificus TaxID=337701 RepID=UPI002A18B5C9|nr:DUF4376 domain-containing protein [Roseovarius pacificus]